MRRLPTSILWLVLVFASGLTMGVVGHRFFAQETGARFAPEQMTRAQLREDYLSKMRSRIGASETQIEQIVQILDRGRAAAYAHKERFDAEMRKMQHGFRSEIRALLTADQAIRYDEWREERRREREAHEKRMEEEQKGKQ